MFDFEGPTQSWSDMPRITSFFGIQIDEYNSIQFMQRFIIYHLLFCDQLHFLLPLISSEPKKKKNFK